MSLREDMWKYEQITGESAEHVPIIKLGAFLDGYEMGVKALEQTELNSSYNSVKTELKPRTNLAETSQDCISRAAALEEFEQYAENRNSKMYVDTIIDILTDLPSVTPQPKVGKWIKTYEPNDAEPFILWECSECQNTERGRRRSKYCPNCGAKMEVEDEKSNNSMR